MLYKNKVTGQVVTLEEATLRMLPNKDDFELFVEKKAEMPTEFKKK